MRTTGLMRYIQEESAWCCSCVWHIASTPACSQDRSRVFAPALADPETVLKAIVETVKDGSSGIMFQSASYA